MIYNIKEVEILASHASAFMQNKDAVKVILNVTTQFIGFEKS